MVAVISLQRRKSHADARRNNNTNRAAFGRRSTPHSGMKSSPYVGWFRHAPPSSVKGLRSMSHLDLHILQPSTMPMKKSPYVGWFRHAPSSRLKLKKGLTGWSHEEILDLLDKLFIPDRKKISNHAYSRKLCVSGRLPGGSPLHENTNDNDSFPPVTWLDHHANEALHRSVHENDAINVGDFVAGEPSSCTSSSSSSSGNSLHTDEDGPQEQSATLNLLARLASWLLFPAGTYGKDSYDFPTVDDFYSRIGSSLTAFLFPFISNLVRRVGFLEDGSHRRLFQPLRYQEEVEQEDDDTVNDEDEHDGSDDESSEYSNYSGHYNHLSNHQTNSDDHRIPSPLGVSVSSMAEAYHAHQATKEVTEPSNNSNIEDVGAVAMIDGERQHEHRLDYVITQMDIARMVRNASRHLDVESILSLPTVTYRSNGIMTEDRVPTTQPSDKAKPGTSQSSKELPADGWSWINVPPDPDSDENNTKDGFEEVKYPHAVTSAHEDDKQPFCVICLEHFNDGDRLRALPCHHLFHIGCIDKWLSGTCSEEECYTSGCPTCKKHPVVQEDYFPTSTDGSVPGWAFARLGDSLIKESDSYSTENS